MEEFEVVYPNINPDEIRKKLKQLGAKRLFDKTYHRLIFDYSDWRLDKKQCWVRLRNEGNRVTLTFKKVIGYKQGPNGNDLGMQENEVVVNDFEKTKRLLLSMGLVVKYDVINKRERWRLDDLEFDIDTYPLIPSYLEIESNSWEKVEQGIELLGLDKNKKKICSTGRIYKENGIDIREYEIMHFDKQVKRKKD